MSTSVIELEMLEGIDAEGSPPCQVKIRKEDYRLCGCPSVTRVHVRCERCHRSGNVFLCAPCLEVMRVQGVACEKCGARDFAWSES